MMPSTALVISKESRICDLANTVGAYSVIETRQSLVNWFHLAGKIWHYLVQYLVDGRALAGVEIMLELDEPIFNHLDRRTNRRSGHNALDTNIGRRLLTREQYLVQPFARADAGEDDVDVTTWFETAQADHSLGQIDDLDRLAHVQHVNRRGCVRRLKRVARRGNDEIAGFADCHEITHHVLMRHRHRPASLDLRLKFRNHRTVRGKHITEPHRDHPHRRFAAIRLLSLSPTRIEGLTIHFREPLRRPEHRDWINRLVRRNHHHCVRASIARRVSNVNGAKHVSLDSFLPIAFEK